MELSPTQQHVLDLMKQGHTLMITHTDGDPVYGCAGKVVRRNTVAALESGGYIVPAGDELIQGMTQTWRIVS